MKKVTQAKAFSQTKQIKKVTRAIDFSQTITIFVVPLTVQGAVVVQKKNTHILFIQSAVVYRGTN